MLLHLFIEWLFDKLSLADLLLVGSGIVVFAAVIIGFLLGG